MDLWDDKINQLFKNLIVKKLNLGMLKFTIEKMVSRILLILLLGSFGFERVTGQQEEIEIFIIDSYISPEVPYKLTLSFFTSDSCLSKVILENNKEYSTTYEFTDFHKVEIDINKLQFKNSFIRYKIVLTDRNNEEFESQWYEVEKPEYLDTESLSGGGLLQVCCFGGIIFGLPSPTIVLKENNKYLSLTKEIPLFSFYGSGYNYPFGYFGVEYAHIFKSANKNFIRVGYKQIFQLDVIKYISVGLNYFSDFKGYNGLSPEVSIGLFQIQNVFTLFTKYRYNFQPDRSGTGFHEISIGLYSNFFSINF